jgi:hypothetical protein
MAFKDEWIDRRDGVDPQTAEDVNLLARGITEVDEKVEEIKISDSRVAVKTITNLSQVQTNKIYSLTTEQAQIFTAPEIEDGVQNQILIYMKATNPVEHEWNGDVLFVNGEKPSFGVGAYRIIIEYNFAIAKWVVGVVQDGAVN